MKAFVDFLDSYFSKVEDVSEPLMDAIDISFDYTPRDTLMIFAICGLSNK